MDFTNRPRSPQAPRPTNQFDPEELPPVDPSPEQPAPPPKRGGAIKKAILGLFLIVLIAVLAAAAAWSYMETEKLKGDISQKESELQLKKDELASLKMAHEKGELEGDDRTSAPNLSEEERMKLAASTYVCILKAISCDKSTQSTVKVIESKPDRPGFALMKVGDSTSASTNLYLKQSGSGNDWVVIYEGISTPSNEVVEKFEIPNELLASSEQ